VLDGLQSLLDPETWRPLIGSLVGAGIALFAGAAIAWVLTKVLARWARLTPTPIDEVIVKRLTSPVRWLLPLASLLLALPALDANERAKALVKQVLVVAITLVVAWAFFRAVKIFEDIVAERSAALGSLKARSHYTQVHGLSNIVRFLIGLTTIGLVLLSFAGVREVGVSMLASAGVAGLAIGFAAQRSIAAVVSGLVIAVAQPIRIGDAIHVEGELGFVEEIGLTFVVVRLLDRRCLIVPISYFLEKPFQNWSRSSTQVRTSVELHLDYSASIQTVRDELKRILEASPLWDKDYSELLVTGTNEQGMVVKANMSAADARKASSLRSEVREKLLTFIQQQCPDAFPRVRTDAPSNPTSKPRPGATRPIG
jgi:small-conductance mechanosensitive channel